MLKTVVWNSNKPMKYSLKIILICVSILSAAPSFALKMKPVNLQQLATQSDAIALIEIETSQTIKFGTLSCGIEHKSKVDKLLKGSGGDTLGFGYMEGLKTGKKYLVFLNKNSAESKLTIFTTTNFQKQFSDKTRLSECRKLQLAEYTLAQAGLAYFEIETNKFFDFKPSIKVLTQYFRLPEGINSVEDKQIPTTHWVSLDELVKIIKSN